MEITKEMLTHYGVSNQEELDDLILTNAGAYHTKTEEWYKTQAETKQAESQSAEMKATIEARGYNHADVESFAKEMGATGINSRILETYAKLNPISSTPESVTADHQSRQSASGIETGKRATSEPESTIDKLIRIKGTLL